MDSSLPERSPEADPRFAGIKAIFFDLMGTCLDWCSSIKPALPSESMSDEDRTAMALDWRQGFFDEIHAAYEQGLAQEDIDVTHRRVLDRLLDQDWTRISMLAEEREAAVRRWHRMQPWPDVRRGIEMLRQAHDVVVLANGTTRLQLDLMKSSAVQFDMLFSSQLLGLTKPDPRIYGRAMDLVGVKPEESLMVAAHAYDLRAAKAVGMRTVYIHRWTEDRGEDMERIQRENDYFLRVAPDSDGKTDGLVELAELLGVSSSPM